MRKIGFLVLLFVTFFCWNSFAQQKQSSSAKKPVDFEKDVLPILEDNCTSCHNSVITKSKLDLEELKGMMKGGKRGTALVPGKPEESLIYLVAARKKKPHMPPLPNEVDAKALTPKELKILERWIREGAKESPANLKTTITMSPLADRLNPIYSLAVSPFGRLAAVGRGNRIHLIDLLTQQRMGTLSDPQLHNYSTAEKRLHPAETAHRDFVHALAFSPDGNTIASAGYRTVKLWRKSRPQFQPKVKGNDDLVALTYDQKSNRIATASKNGTVQIFDFSSPLTALHTFQRQNVDIRKLFLASDGKYLLLAKAKTGLELVEIVSGKTISSKSVPSEIRDVIISEKGNIAIACADNVIRVSTLNDLLPSPSKTTTKQKKNLQKKKQWFEELKGHSKSITAMAALKNERFLSAGEDGTIRIWDYQKQLKLIAHGTPVVKIAAGGKLVATTSTDNTVRVWNLDSGKQVSSWKKTPEEYARLAKKTTLARLAVLVAQVANRDLAKAKKNQTAREQEVKKAKDEKQKADKALADAEMKFKTADDHLKKARSTSKKKPKDNKLKQQVTNAQKAQAATKAQRDRAKKAVQNAERSITIANRGLNQANVSLKNTEANKKQADENQKKQSAEFEQLKKQTETKKLDIQNFSFAADNQTLLLVTKTGNLHFYHAPDGTPLEEIPKPKSGDVRFLEKFGNDFVYGLSNGEIGMLNVTPRWSFIAQLGVSQPGSQDVSESPFQNRVLALDFSADGKFLTTGGGDPSREGELILWDVEKETIVRKFENTHSDTIHAVKFSHDGKFLLTGSADKFAKIFDVASGKMLRSFEGHAHHVMDVAWNADNSRVATAGADNIIKIWDSRTGDLKRTIAGFGKQVSSVEFLGFGSNILSCSGDTTVRFHKTKNGQNYRRFNGGTNFMHVSRGVRTIKNTLENKEPSFVLSGGEDGILHLWNAADAKLLKLFDFKEIVPRNTAGR